MGMMSDADNVDVSNLEKVVKYICDRLLVLWKSCSRMKSTVINKHSKWLSVKESVNLPKASSFKENTSHDISDQPSSSGIAAAVGRPKKDFATCSKRSQRRRLAMLSQLDESAVSNLMETSDPGTNEIIPLDAVLSLITEAKLTKHQYLLIRNFINSRRNPILPSYNKILEAKQKCYPEDVRVTETTAEVELQSLLNHTAARIIESQREVLSAIPQESMGDVFLIGKWGFDGSTGHSEYKQNFASSDDVTDDGSLFVTSYVPLRLVSTDTSSEETILWKNPRPSSTRYCRPVRFQFIKETKDSTINELNYFQEKIDKLVPTKLSYGDNKEINVNHILQLTMVDGKICSAISSASSAKCYICGALPKDMNDIDSCIKRDIDKNRLEFGLSPLHSWIRFFEYFIHLSYKLQTQRWQARSEEDKELVKVTKKRIQDEFRQKLGLIVDKPRSGGSGTSNDGNTARKFFKNPVISAEITGIQQCLIERCGTILECMSSGYKINTAKFEEYALDTARRLVAEYPWYNLPSSVHKVLIHGAVVIDNALVSIGELSEEAAESTNKNIKSFRLKHTRKISRVTTNTDLMNRLLLNSDPLITSCRKLPRKKKSLLSSSVLSLLDTSN